MGKFSPRARAHMDRAEAARRRGKPQEAARELADAYDKGTPADRAKLDKSIRASWGKKR